MTARVLRRGLSLALPALTAISAACGPRRDASPVDDWRAGTREHAVAINGDQRTFLLHIPTRRPRNRLGINVGFPLVVLLHGSGANGETVRRQSGIERLADSLHFLVAYPNGSTGAFGLGSDWDAGTCCGTAARTHVDDVGFVRALVDRVARQLPVDRRRIYIAGFSDGGRMAYHMACDADQLVAAVGIVSGSLVDDSCRPARAVPVIAFHGTADTEVPYADSARTAPPRPAPAAAAQFPPAVRFWAGMNECRQVAVRRETAHVLLARFAPCGGADVVFYQIDDGTHSWPGGEKDGPSGYEPTTELNATESMVRFFLRHRRG